MIYAYIRVSTDKQTTENQEFEILRFANEKNFHIDKQIKETISSSVQLEKRELFKLLKKLQKDDVLIITEISRLGRSLLEVMGILNELMQKGIKVFSVKEHYELGDNLNSKVLAFAFSLAAEIERSLISQRTKEALARKKSEGMKLGRPYGSLSRTTKLTGKEKEIKNLLEKKVNVANLAKMYEVDRETIKRFIKNKKLK